LAAAASAAVVAVEIAVSSSVPQTQAPFAVKREVVLAVAVVPFCTEMIVCCKLPKKLAPAFKELQNKVLPTSVVELKAAPEQVN
jgi:hypothetical protein